MVRAKNEKRCKCATIMEWYTAVKKIKTTLYVPVCKDHQDILLNEKSKLQKKCVEGKEGLIFACLCTEHF